MEKRNYIFKLNVQPHILKKYYNKIDELKSQIIPNTIFNAYNDLFSNPVMKEDKMSSNECVDFLFNIHNSFVDRDICYSK